MLERTCRMYRLVLQVKIDAPLEWQWEDMQMGVGTAVRVRLDDPDGLAHPGTTVQSAHESPRNWARSFARSVARPLFRSASPAVTRLFSGRSTTRPSGSPTTS